MAEIRVPAWPIPIQNTKVVMYIAHIWGTRLPAMPMPHQTCPAQAAKNPASNNATKHIQAKYRLPGGSRVRRTSRLTSANVGDAVVRPSLIGSRVSADDLAEIGDRGPCPDLLQDVVRPRRMRQLGRPALFVLQIAERDRLRRTRLLARRLDVPVPNRALLVLRPVFAGDDPLHAHRAFFHHAELAHGDVRVQLHLERRRELVLEPVEAPYVVRAVVA